MCGIAGILSRDGRSCTGETLRRMLYNLRHRGPEELGIYLGAGAGLAHARLGIVDLSTGRQPMQSEDGSKWIVFNGEIFNYLELRKDLSARGFRFRTTSDTEVLLRCYEEKGPACLDDLNGQFAFAVWDRRARALFLARDRVGICPLYYAFCGGDFLFASEIKGIFSDSRVPREIDPLALDDVFTFWFPLAPRTAFKGVFELPPAHWMVVDRHGIRRIERYWDLPQAADGRSRKRSPAEFAARLRALLLDATRLRLRADVPVGAYLSGGLDSSVVAAVAAKYFPGTHLRTFSVRFDSPEFDEGQKQFLVAQRLGARHEELHCQPRDIGRVFREVVWHAETPLVRTAPAPMYLLSKLVRDRGLKVVLTGEGADEILAGYDIFKAGKIRRFVEACPGSVLRPLLLGRLYPYLARSPARLAAYARSFFFVPPSPFSESFRSHAPRWKTTAQAKVFFSSELRKTLEKCEPAAERIHRFFSGVNGSRGHDPLWWEQKIEFKTLLPAYLLSAQGDRMLMGHSVEGRFPFLDHRVIEFCATVPPGLRLKGLREKHLLREAMADLLPSEVCQAVKQPYRAPQSTCFFNDGASAETMELLSGPSLRFRGYFDPEKVRLLVEKCRIRRAGGFRDDTALVGIVSTVLLDELFIRRFPAPQPLDSSDPTVFLDGDAFPN